jgi:potassium/hydrogen antiporter
MELSDGIKSLLTEIVLPENSEVAGKQIVQLGLPPNTLISFIKRNGKYITPGGSTVLEKSTIFATRNKKFIKA